MKSGLVLEFTKMHGAGNDFIVIDNRFFRLSDEELSAVAAEHCRRRTGVGADGLLALNQPTSDDFDYRMRYVNADGSVTEMCGNGARCLAAFAREGGINPNPLRFETDAGPYRAHVDPMDPTSIKLIVPSSQQVDTSFATIPVEGGADVAVAFMITGVPHAVWFGSNIADIPVEKWGRRIRRHPAFAPTSGTNVDFVQVESGPDGNQFLRIRTYERGVEAETLACGTGALSSLVAAYETGRISSREVAVEMPGGLLNVGYVDGTEEMFLEGPVAVAFRGTIVI